MANINPQAEDLIIISDDVTSTQTPTLGTLETSTGISSEPLIINASPVTISRPVSETVPQNSTTINDFSFDFNLTGETTPPQSVGKTEVAEQVSDIFPADIEISSPISSEGTSPSENDDMDSILSITISKLKERQATINGIKDKKNTRISELTHQIEELQHQVSDLKDDVNDLKEEHTKIDNNVAQLESMKMFEKEDETKSREHDLKKVAKK